jgi:hypothetical protein
MTHINTTIDRLIRIKDSMTNRADRDAINDACEALSRAHNVARPLGLKLAVLLDAALPYLDKAAEREAAQEAGKVMRQITCQSRAKAAKDALAKSADVFGFDL